MKLRYWVIITFLAGVAIVVSAILYLNSKETVTNQCFDAAALNKLTKDWPKPNNGKCPEGYILNGYYCPGSPTWCEPKTIKSNP